MSTGCSLLVILWRACYSTAIQYIICPSWTTYPFLYRDWGWLTVLCRVLPLLLLVHRSSTFNATCCFIFSPNSVARRHSTSYFVSRDHYLRYTPPSVRGHIVHTATSWQSSLFVGYNYKPHRKLSFLMFFGSRSHQWLESELRCRRHSPPWCPLSCHVTVTGYAVGTPTDEQLFALVCPLIICPLMCLLVCPLKDHSLIQVEPIEWLSGCSNSQVCQVFTE